MMQLATKHRLSKTNATFPCKKNTKKLSKTEKSLIYPIQECPLQKLLHKMQVLRLVSEEICLILNYLKRKVRKENMSFYHKSKESEEELTMTRNYQIKELTKTSSRFPLIAHIKSFQYRFRNTTKYLKNHYLKSTMDSSFINSFTTFTTR